MPVRQEPVDDVAHEELLEGYVLLRSSHPVKQMVILQEGKELLVLEADDEAGLSWTVSHGRAELEVQVEWAAFEGEAYCELEFEPDGLETRKAGFWGHGSVTQLLEVAWPHHH